MGGVRELRAELRRIAPKFARLLLHRDLLPPSRAEVVLHRFLLHHLHRVSHAAVALHHLDHLAEAALAEDAHHLEVGERRLDVLLRLELEDVLELHRAEELLERRRVELREHARLDRQEDLAQLALLGRRVGGVRVGVEHPLETLVHVVDHVVVEVAEERLRRALGDVLGGEALRLGLDRVEVGEVLVLLARRVEVEGLQQLGARVLLRDEELAEEAGVRLVAHHLVALEAQPRRRRHGRLLRLGGRLRQLVQPLRLIRREEAEEAAGEPRVRREELLQKRALDAHDLGVLVRRNRRGGDALLEQRGLPKHLARLAVADDDGVRLVLQLKLDAQRAAYDLEERRRRHPIFQHVLALAVHPLLGARHEVAPVLLLQVHVERAVLRLLVVVVGLDDRVLHLLEVLRLRAVLRFL